MSRRSRSGASVRLLWRAASTAAALPLAGASMRPGESQRLALLGGGSLVAAVLGAAADHDLADPGQDLLLLGRGPLGEVGREVPGEPALLGVWDGDEAAARGLDPAPGSTFASK